jgi:hypothetical protein
MQGSLDNPPIVIRQDRFWACWFLLIPAGVIFGFAATISRRGWAHISILDYALLVAAILCMLAMVLSMIRPATLTVSPKGLVWRTFLRTSHFDWVDFVEFGVISRPIFVPLLPREWAAGKFSRRSRKHLSAADSVGICCGSSPSGS